NALLMERQGERVDRGAKPCRFTDECRDVVEDNASLRKVGNVTNLRLQVVHRLPDEEPRIVSARRHLLHVHRIDARPWRPAPDVTLKALEGFEIAFRQDLDAAVGTVRDPPVQPFQHRSIFDEKPKADALNAAADQVPARDPHETARYRNILPAASRR